MSPLHCSCHLFILALTKGNHASEKMLYWKGLNLWNVQKNGSTWFKSSRHSLNLKANNQKHDILPFPWNDCLFFTGLLWERILGSHLLKQGVLLPCNYYLTSWGPVINKSCACFSCMYNHMLHICIDRGLQNIYLWAQDWQKPLCYQVSSHRHRVI